ncbi:MAG TPA: amidohydrolase family protein, partial [Smithellaceae bacterium]|nr:amidohydrolase family protein [Smithellaceae bacterium]
FGGGTKQEDTGAEYGLKWFNEIIGLMKDYPNVYADVSSSLAGKHKDNFKELFKDWYNKEIKHVDNVIRSRILFGTDWYMTLMDNVDYLEYVRDAKSFIDSLDNDLWFQMSQVNPYRFYRLDEQIYRIRDNLFSIMDPDDEDVKRAGLKGYKKNDLYKINQVADLIWSANKPYDPHKEGRK